MARRPAFSLPAQGFNQLVECRQGIMIYNRNDQYVGESLHRYGEFSPGEAELFRKILKPGMLVVEIGANIGAHTVELSQLVGWRGTVVAFEPQRVVFQTLCANIALNNCANVYTFQSAVGDHVGTIKVPFLPPEQLNNFGGLSLRGVEAGEDVPLTTLDTLNLPTCHLLKIDVEGMEVEVLRGAAATIERCRPVIYAEDDRAERSAELVQLLADYRYNMFRHEPPLFSPDNFAGEQQNIFGNIASRNLFCIPEEFNLVVEGLQEVTAPPKA